MDNALYHVYISEQWLKAKGFSAIEVGLEKKKMTT